MLNFLHLAQPYSLTAPSAMAALAFWTIKRFIVFFMSNTSQLILAFILDLAMIR